MPQLRLYHSGYGVLVSKVGLKSFPSYINYINSKESPEMAFSSFQQKRQRLYYINNNTKESVTTKNLYEGYPRYFTIDERKLVVEAFLSPFEREVELKKIFKLLEIFTKIDDIVSFLRSENYAGNFFYKISSESSNLNQQKLKEVLCCELKRTMKSMKTWQSARRTDTIPMKQITGCPYGVIDFCLQNILFKFIPFQKIETRRQKDKSFTLQIYKDSPLEELRMHLPKRVSNKFYLFYSLYYLLNAKRFYKNVLLKEYEDLNTACRRIYNSDGIRIIFENKDFELNRYSFTQAVISDSLDYKNFRSATGNHNYDKFINYLTDEILQYALQYRNNK